MGQGRKSGLSPDLLKLEEDTPLGQGRKSGLSPDLLKLVNGLITDPERTDSLPVSGPGSGRGAPSPRLRGLSKESARWRDLSCWRCVPGDLRDQRSREATCQHRVIVVGAPLRAVTARGHLIFKVPMGMLAFFVSQYLTAWASCPIWRPEGGLS